MDIYLTSGGERLRIPLNPDRLSVKMGTTAISFQILQQGEHKIPRGTSLTGYSWNGVFPGQSMAGMSFVHDWQPPIRIITTLERWMKSNAIVQLMVTETAINDNVFIESFVYDHYGLDNVSYTLTLTAYRPLYVTTAPPQPEVIIPVQQEEKKETTTTKTQSTQAKSTSSSSKDGQKSNTSTTNSAKKLSVTIPTKAVSAIATTAAAVKVVATTASVLANSRIIGNAASAARKAITAVCMD